MQSSDRWSQFRTVLLDPDADARSKIAAILDRAGHDLIAVTGDPGIALNATVRYRPDLFLIDVELPGVDGVVVAGKATTSTTGVVVITSKADRETVGRAVEAGVASFVAKPLTEPRLLAAIEVAYVRASTAAERRRTVEDLSRLIETRDTIDRAKRLLMDSRGMNENKAYRHLQRRSMDTRRSIREVAEAVIITIETVQAEAQRPWLAGSAAREQFAEAAR
jgi:response regulator NasT